MEKAQTDMLFEASWEVCNKVGGIYTVVKSKVELMKDNYHNYFMVGPFFSERLGGNSKFGNIKSLIHQNRKIQH